MLSELRIEAGWNVGSRDEGVRVAPLLGEGLVAVDQWLVSFRIRCAYHHLLTCWRQSDRIKLLDSLLQSQTMHGLQVLGLFDVVTKLFYVEAGRLHAFTGPLLTMSDRGR